jgi:mediator of RNA polymerase II transcription subunit 13
MASRQNQVQSTPFVRISPSDQLLANRIVLPLDPSIAYSVFASSAHESIETARRLILLRNASAVLLDSLLTSVHIGTTSFLYVFLVSAQSQLDAAMSTLSHLQLDGLTGGSSSLLLELYPHLVRVTLTLIVSLSPKNLILIRVFTAIETSSFMPQDLYPCSPSCSPLRKPCTTCLDHVIPTSTASLSPRKPLRSIYINFMEAVRIRLLDDIVSASVTKPSNTTGRPVKRLKGGFLLGTPSSKNEWSATWDDRAMAR